MTRLGPLSSWAPWALSLALALAWAAQSWRPEPAVPVGYAALYPRVAPSVVAVRVDGEAARVGAGFAVGPTRVLTARHLVIGVDSLVVVGADGRSLDARVVGTDARDDLALLEVAEGRFPAVQVGRAADLRVGDPVITIGNPFGLGLSVSAGLVAAGSRRVQGADGVALGPEQGFLQLSIPLNPGNSGGPVFDAEGRVVGVLSGTHAQGQAIAFAVPIEVIDDVLPRMSAGARLSRAFLGARAESVGGALSIAAVTPGGPADRAGIRAGDRVVSVDGRPIASPEALHALLDELSGGAQVDVGIERAGAPQTTQVVLADWAEHTLVVAGMTLGPTAGTGGEVLAVRPGSRAERGGARIGDVVRAVGGIPVQAPADVQQAIAMGRGPVEVLRDGVAVVVALPDPG